MHGPWIVPLMILAGMAAGALWAAPVAYLRNRYGVNEILSSLMLVYVALQLLNYLVTGPWKDPNGQNFPQTAPFTPDQRLPADLFGLPFPPGLYIAFALALVFWLVMARSEFGLGVRIVGEAPKAARYAGYRASDAVWSTLLISGAMAGLAGVSGGDDAIRASSISAFPRATASPRSSSRSSAGCIRSASCWRASCWRSPMSAARWRRRRCMCRARPPASFRR